VSTDFFSEAGTVANEIFAVSFNILGTAFRLGFYATNTTFWKITVLPSSGRSDGLIENS
jgi:hypothetical protein